MTIHYSYSVPLFELNGQHAVAVVWVQLNEPMTGSPL